MIPRNLKKPLLAVCVALVALLGIPSLPKKADAQVPPCTYCLDLVTQPQYEQKEWFAAPGGTLPLLMVQITSEFAAMTMWYENVFFKLYWLPAFQQTTSQLTAVAMQQTMMFGALLDAKQQLETQQVLQKLSARARKDYQPSVGLCEFGSSAKSLAASERKGEYTAIVLAQRAQDRALGAANTSAAISGNDKALRFKQFREKFCDPNDNNGGLQNICETKTPAKNSDGSTPDSKINKDIDFARTIDAPWTLDVDFTDEKTTGTDAEEVLALASNLYGHDVFERPSASLDKDWIKKYMDVRSVVAKRNVAQNSFNAIVGMKSAGTAGSKDYLSALMQDLGVSVADADKMVGANPSYYAQMEVLTKKIYQNPDFYTNLYDTPVNVARKGVALQAINLMQKFDLFKSYLRNEASLSVLLEIALTDIQGELEND